VIVKHIGSGVWLASGMGYDRPILAEGYTREQAHQSWVQVYAEQYEQAQREDNLTIFDNGEY
jgi:hypothetical protein